MMQNSMILDKAGKPVGMMGTLRDISDIKQAEEVLRETHDELEWKVKERTAELVKTNEQLKREITERKEAEEALRKSEERYRNLVEDSLNAIVLYRQEEILFANEAFCNTYGYEREELQGMVVDDFLAPEVADGVAELRQRRLAGEIEKTAVYESKGRRKGGEIFDVEISVCVVSYQGEQCCMAFLSDISKRKEAEEALKKSEEKFSKLFQASPAYISLVTLEDGRFLAVNDAFEKSTGYKRNELIGHTVYELGLWTNPDNRDNLVKLIKEKGQLRSQRITLTRKDGKLIEGLWSMERIEIDGEDCTISVFEDITQLVEIQEELRQSEELYRSVVEQASEGIFLWDYNTKEILDTNKAFRNMLGYTNKEIPKLTLHDFIAHETEDIDSNIHHIAKEKFYFIGERKYRSKNGTLLDIEASASLISFGGKEVICVVVRDITDRKRAEEALQKAHGELELRVANRTAALSEANEQLGLQIEERKRAEEQIKLSLKEKKVLLAEIHHRVKNNLQVVSSLLGMTRTRTDNPEAVELLSRAQSRVFTMALIHSQLYENDRFTDIDMGKHARQLMLHLTQIYGKEKDITPVIRASDITLSLTYAVPCAMVLNELIANTFKHAYREEEEGIIEVTMERSPDDKFSLMVKDYGVGVPKEADIDETACLGLKLAKNLVRRQLKGHFQMRGNNGTEVLVDFQLLREE